MWIVYSFLATFSNTTKQIFSKKVVNKQDEFIAMWSFGFWGFVVSFFYVVAKGFVVSDDLFWSLVLIRIVTDIIAIYTYFRALKVLELSFVAPMIALLPVLTAITSFFLNKEKYSIVALLGVLTIVFSVFLLFSDSKKNNILKDKDKRIAIILLLITLIIWANMEALHKKLIGMSSPATYFSISFFGFALVYTLIVVIFRKDEFRRVFNKGNFIPNIVSGVFVGLERLFSLNAIVTGLVASVNAIKSTSILATTILSVIFLKEKFSRLKLISSILAVIGIILIIAG